MEKVCKYENCTGCSLCAAICPKSCIKMQEGKLGHLFPVVDTASCIDCGLCAGACPANSPAGVLMPSAAYAAWARDSREYVSSTSGGAASVLSRHVLSQDGAVYGCAVCKGDSVAGKPFSVKHIRVTSTDGLQRLKGSKYVQSSIAEVLPEIREDVRSGRKVLFVGTPCQVAAVKAMFKTVPEGLYLVDLICHGVPSLSMLQKYVSGHLHIDPQTVSDVSFRGPEGFVMRILGTDGSVLYGHEPLSGLRTEDLYYSLFMDGFTYRDSCYRCPYARTERVSDITIGDFWGLGDDVPDHPHGVSLLLPVTRKGMEMLSAVKGDMDIYTRSVQEAVRGNDQLRSPRRKSLRIRLFRMLEPVFGLRVYYAIVADWIARKYFKRDKSR